MPELNMLFDTEAVKVMIEAHHDPKGIPIDLVDGTHVRFRIERQKGNVYYGVIDDGRSALMNIVTGQFDMGD